MEKEPMKDRLQRIKGNLEVLSVRTKTLARQYSDEQARFKGKIVKIK